MKHAILALALAFLFAAKAQAGVSTYRIEVSTPVDTPILLLSGDGALYSIDCSSGATSSYTIAFDSAATTGITVLTAGKAITPQVYSSGTSFVANTKWSAGSGTEAITFYNGLVALTHGGVINCLYRVGPNGGSYP
jgi:hypothetical protein